MTQKEISDLLFKAIDLLKKEVSGISYETWIKSMEIVSFDNNHITLLANSSVHKEMLESRWYDLITNTFKYLTNKDCTISVITPEDKKEAPSFENDYNNYTANNPNRNYLNPKYTFETFVVGENNRFAHAAALAVSEQPGEAYNPLFLYGGVGLGKTHLIHAVGNFVLKSNKDAKVLYITSEKFTNEFINAIKDNTNEKFRAKYRSIDLLLIDDIQFFAGKERVQEEFFHTFNTLHENGKQIIITSDKPPKDIYPLEERLKSRFEWGLIADISMPDYETRVAILRKKIQTENILVDDEILSNIAIKVDSNIRELEGALNKLIAIASLTQEPISMEMSEKAINDIITAKGKVISLEYIQEVVSKYFDITIFDLKSSKRSINIAYPRQIAMFLCREITGMSFDKIGEAFGKRDHSTVMHATQKIDKEIRANKETQLIVDSVKNSINSK